MITKLAILLLAGSAVLSAIMTAVVKKRALRVGLVSRPTADRYHRSVVPFGGGVAIYGTIIAILLWSLLGVYLIIAPGHLDQTLGESVTIHTKGFVQKTPELIVVMLCLTALFALGFWDDIKHLSPVTKLITQFIVAFIAAITADIRVELFIESKLITSIISAFWIVLIINAFNFLDNMDGACAGIAVIASSVLFIAAANSGQLFVGAIALVLIGTLLGFLTFNFPPASIFMGDAGSMVVGFMIALLTLRTTYYHESASGPWYPVMMPLIVMAVPLYDFASVTLLRLRQGKSPFIGDTQHFSHRLKRRGLSDVQVALTLYVATLVTGLGATFLYQVNLAGAILIFAQTMLILAIIAILETTSENKEGEG